MATSNEKKLSLKIMVDVKAKKVVFAEANHEFVNFIVSLMSLPLSSVTRVLLQNKKSMVGSLGTLYNSIESLDSLCFDKETYKDSVFKARATVTVPLLSLHESPVSYCKFFHCNSCKKHSTAGRIWCCNYYMAEVSHTCPAIEKPTLEIVKRGAFYVVTDSLEVKPMSVEFIKSNALEIHDLEEKQVEIGLQEGLAILKASMETNAVLTSVFLKKI